MADGKFAEPTECPVSIMDPVARRQVCGICGSDQIEQGYGLGTGYGIGAYTFCEECNTFLDFVEDSQEC